MTSGGQVMSLVYWKGLTLWMLGVNLRRYWIGPIGWYCGRIESFLDADWLSKLSCSLVWKVNVYLCPRQLRSLAIFCCLNVQQTNRSICLELGIRNFEEMCFFVQIAISVLLYVLLNIFFHMVYMPMWLLLRNLFFFFFRCMSLLCFLLQIVLLL